MATETPGEKVPEPPKGGDEKKSMMVIIGGVLTRVRFPDGLKEILASDTDEKSDVVLEMGKNQKYPGIFFLRYPNGNTAAVTAQDVIVTVKALKGDVRRLKRSKAATGTKLSLVGMTKTPPTAA